MPTNRTAVATGDRELRRASSRFGDDFREIRRRAGVSQADVARAIGVDRSVICRLERGDTDITSLVRARAAAVLGAEFRFGLYAEGPALIRDAAQAAIVERLLSMRHRRWRATLEAPVPGPGRRSSDARLEHGEDVVLTEVESRVGVLESIVRECHDKRRAVAEAEPGRRVHVVLVLPPTRHHRALVRAHPETIRVAFPIASGRLAEALSSQSGPWPGDGILWLPARATSAG
jgi:transcriptional regulator with XRE-family HTH domain